MPVVLGHEISGHVDASAPASRASAPATAWSRASSCRAETAPSCGRGRDDLCETYFAINRVKGVLYDGKTRLFRPTAPGSHADDGRDGAVCDRADTDVFRLPASLPLEESCILGCALMTAYGAAKNAAQIRDGQSVVVIGAGGVGSNVITMARLFGATR
jgi:S-(hydroxymethyl)glutathione dehydrogenase/alcohol dehydrogenase